MLDIDRILNESPKKRLLIGYQNLKENFNESSARDFFNIYKDQPLSFILENSRLIFSEPFFGRNFYKEVFEHAHEYPCVFVKSGEIDKVREYLESNKKHMSEIQVNEYTELLSFMERTISESSALLFIESTATESNPEFSKEMSDALYEKDVDTVTRLFESIESASNFFAFTPSVFECTNDIGMIREKMFEIGCIVDEGDQLDSENFKKFAESSLIVNRLFTDSYFKEKTINKLPRPMRMVYQEVANEDLQHDVYSLKVRTVPRIPVSNVYNAASAVNNVFTNITLEFAKDDFSDIKEYNELMESTLYNVLFDRVYQEYCYAEDTSAKIIGYPYLEGMSIEDAFHYVTEKVNSYNTGKPSKVIAQHSTDMREESNPKKDNAQSQKISNEDDDLKSETSSTKPVKPHKKDLATRIQNKAMDIESKEMKAMQKLDETGQKIAGAVKAVKNIPDNITDKIKQIGHEWDVADDDRRKEYMIEPGYRKKIFRNLKLAIAYGSAASANILLVPVVAFIRHLSKTKDRRIRTELIRELDTEIKVCDEKIADANANGDQKQKYQLMRIKSKLEAESVRVKTNSKYI